MNSNSIKKLFPYLPSNVIYIQLGNEAENPLIPLSLPQVFTELARSCPSLKTLIVNSAALPYSNIDSLANEDVEDEAYLEKDYTKEVSLDVDISHNIAEEKNRKYAPLKHLTMLSVRRTLFDSYDLFSNMNAFVLPQLEILDLTGSNCVFISLPITLNGLNNLQELYLGGTGIQDGALQQMRSCLKQVKVLDLEGVYFENCGLFDIIKDSQCLEKLYVGYSVLANDTFLSRLKPDIFPHLTVLCLRYTSVSTRGVKELEKTWGSLKLATAFDNLYSYILFNGVTYCDHFLENHFIYD